MSDQQLKPWHDCPPCPSCGGRVGCPTRHKEPGRWIGPDEANLFCPACGTGWVGNGEDLGQAEFARDAWDRKLYVECGEQNLLAHADHCLKILNDPETHNAGKGQAVYELTLFLRDGLDKARAKRAAEK